MVSKNEMTLAGSSAKRGHKFGGKLFSAQNTFKYFRKFKTFYLEGSLGTGLPWVGHKL